MPNPRLSVLSREQVVALHEQVRIPGATSEPFGLGGGVRHACNGSKTDPQSSEHARSIRRSIETAMLRVANGRED